MTPYLAPLKLSYLCSKYDGKKWCYVDPKNNQCPDSKAASQIQGEHWSFHACVTPSKHDPFCSGSGSSASTGGRKTKCVERFEGRCTCWEEYENGLYDGTACT